MSNTADFFLNWRSLDDKCCRRRHLTFDTRKRKLQFLQLFETHEKLLVICNNGLTFTMGLLCSCLTQPIEAPSPFP